MHIVIIIFIKKPPPPPWGVYTEENVEVTVAASTFCLERKL